MIPIPDSNGHQKRLLTRFIRQVEEINDTPSLIMLLAADADFLRLCLTIVDPDANANPALAEVLISVCRDNGMSPTRLKANLTLAARALGIVQSSGSSSDYYQLLGVRSQANAQEIKKAFRRKAIIVHPDANANLTGGSQGFIELNDAYRTLRDPVLRHHYDINQHHLLRWRERSPGPSAADARPTIFWWYFYGLIFIFILLLLFLDMIAFKNVV